MKSIEIENAGKCINDVWIYKNISVSFECGNIYGLIGRNGAGKTMLLKSICGLSRVTTGYIKVEGKIVGKDVDFSESTGAIIEMPGFLPNLSGFENLKYLAMLKNKIDDETITAAINKVGLSPTLRKSVGKYSLGMRQRLGIAQAIMENPNILLLDEPMNGLDNQGVKDMKRLLKELRTQGKLIIVASHHMDDIAELCDKVYLMDAGHLKEYVMK